MRIKYFFIYLIVLNFSNQIYCQKQIVLNKNLDYLQIHYNLLEAFEDPTNKLTFKEIQNQKFVNCTKKLYNSGYNNSKFWYRITLKSIEAQKWIFNCGGTLVDEIELYELNEKGNLINKRITGDHFLQSEREIRAATFAFQMYLANNDTRTLYISISSQDTKMYNFRLFTEAGYRIHSDNKMYPSFFYFGMIFMMALYNLLLFFSVRDKTYLYYVFYILSFGLFQFTIFGFGNQFIWGESIWFSNRASTVFTGLSTIFITLFSYNFLNISILYPKLKPWFLFLLISGAICILLSIPKPTHIFNYNVAIFSLINISILILIGIKVWWNGYKPARYYMMAWGSLFISILIFILNSTTWMPSNPFNFTILPFGCILEVAIFSFALGKRINTTEKEKTNVQKELVKQLKANEEVRKNIARDLHDDLGSTLSSIRILSEIAENEVINHPEKLPILLNKITKSSQKIQENLQDIVWTTQNKDNSVEDLMVKIRLFGGELLEAKNINYVLELDKNFHQINHLPNIQYDIFMIFKEAINNIVKYAEAKNVIVKFRKTNDGIVFEIIDDGVGFDVEKEKEGNGLKNMPKRAENMGGILDIKSKIGSGTQIIFSLPVPN